jgi:hypothetical protein
LGRSLDFDLFGTAPTQKGEENPEIMGSYLKPQGKASGSDRLTLEDYLQRPQKEGGAEEVLYISARAEREYEYTIDNRGATGWWRDHWDNEARSLLDATIKEVREKRQEYLDLVKTDPEAARSERAHLIIRDMHFARATIRGDRAGYEKATAELRAAFQAVASFVLQAVLTAVLTPFATALFAARLAQAGAMAVRFATWTKNMAVGMASTIAANKTVYGNDYNTDMLLHDLKGGLGSAIGATGAERLLGPVTQRLTDRLGKTMAGEVIAGAKTVGGMEMTAILEGEPANVFENFLEQHFLGKVGEGITHATTKAFKPGPKPGTPQGAIEEPHARVSGAGAGHEVGPTQGTAAEPLADEIAEPEQEAAVSMQLPEPGVVQGREAKRTPRAEKHEPSAESAEQVPPDPMAGKRAPDEPAPDEPAPREDTDVDIPRAPESERMRANREEQERRAKQYPVDVSALRESTSPDARARRLAAAFAPLYPRWENLHPVERLAALEAVINEQLRAAGLPHVYVESASLPKGDAEFNLKTWKIQVSEVDMATDKLTPEQFAGICSDAAHEARHALHHFRGLRAALQEGQFNPSAKIKVRSDVVEAAQRANEGTWPAEVLPSDSPAYREGLEIYQQTFGSGAERREAVKARLERTKRQAAEAAAEVEKHPEGSAARQAAELARKSAEEAWREAHNAYVALPQETDAWRRGTATKAAVVQRVLQDRLAVVEKARAQAAADQRAAKERYDKAGAEPGGDQNGPRAEMEEALARYRAAVRDMRELQRQLTEPGQREPAPEAVAPGRLAGRGTEPGTESAEQVPPEPAAGKGASRSLHEEEKRKRQLKLLILRGQESVIEVGPKGDAEEVAATWKGGSEFDVEYLGKSASIDVSNRAKAFEQIRKLGLDDANSSELLEMLPAPRTLISFAIEKGNPVKYLKDRLHYKEGYWESDAFDAPPAEGIRVEARKAGGEELSAYGLIFEETRPWEFKRKPSKTTIAQEYQYVDARGKRVPGAVVHARAVVRVNEKGVIDHVIDTLFKGDEAQVRKQLNDLFDRQGWDYKGKDGKEKPYLIGEINLTI